MKEVMRNIFLKLIFNTQEKYVNFIVTYHFYSKKMKLRKVEKHVSNLHDKNWICCTHELFKTGLGLGHGLVLKEFHKVIKFNQNDWLKPCIVMNIELSQKSKTILRKIFSS